MPYALNTKKGTTIQHPNVTLKGGEAVMIDEKLAIQLKHIIGVVVFDRVIGAEREIRKEEPKGLYNLNPKTLQEVKS